MHVIPHKGWCSFYSRGQIYPPPAHKILEDCRAVDLIIISKGDKVIEKLLED